VDVIQTNRRKRRESPHSRRSLLGIEIDNLSLDELLGEMRSGFVVTPNVNHVMLMKRDLKFREAYQSADYYLCDSQILMKIFRWLGQPIRQKISGSDLLPAFYHYHWENPEIKIFLLGAEEGVGTIAMNKINSMVGRPIVVDTYSPPWGFEHDPIEGQKIGRLIEQSGATVLVLGLGTPKQEKWFYQYRQMLERSVNLTFAIGTTINFEAGHTPRAPRWMRSVGLEWLYRLCREPKRLWRRYLFDVIPLIQLVIQEKWQRRSFPRPPVLGE
jgi:N-acetylglucosaminyldiphosphoundecaprenol N-acetyl-beta-D-mannosaminyltransferase